MKLQNSFEHSKEECLNTEPNDVAISKSGCCFLFPSFNTNQSTTNGSEKSSWERIHRPESKERWWVSLLKKVKQWKEGVAELKWKTFIRRCHRKMKIGPNSKFQYDPLSYARNFDEGLEQNGSPEEYRYRSFSVRYAAIPTSAKSSMDLGNDGPDFAMDKR